MPISLISMRFISSILQQFSNKDLLYIKHSVAEILATRLSFRERSRLVWDHKKYSRNLYNSPYNPSKGDLELYKKFLRDGGNKRALLLGSTPLLRYVLSELGFEKYIVADFSFKTIEGSLQALYQSNINLDTDNEIWLKSDWLDMPLNPHSLDYIVGDFVLTQIEPGKQLFFIKKLSSLLKESGIFIGRMYFCNPEKDHQSPKQIIEEVVSSKDFENTIEQRFLLLYKLRDRLRDKNTQTTSHTAIADVLLQYKTLDEKVQDFLRGIIKMMSVRIEANLSHISQTKEEQERLLTKEFSIKIIATASDYPSRYYPVYVLEKRRK